MIGKYLTLNSSTNSHRKEEEPVGVQHPMKMKVNATKEDALMKGCK